MSLLFFYTALLIPAVHSYTPAPRWGQATSLISSYLYIQGGKQDADNSMSYTSALAEEDLLYLPLADSFSVDSPPWQLISDHANATNSQGPAVAWHTLSAYNSSMLLLFGGMPSPTVPLATQPDSGWLLDVFNRVVPQFTPEASGWGNEPMRRMHHAAVSATTGEVYIFGGETADGSVAELSDHYVFNPNGANFTLLPTDNNAPPALTGHAAIILPNGQIYIFGGLASTGLLSFGTIWILDTSTNTWSSQTISSTPPPGRRGFASVLLDNNAILIHGGCSADFQQTYSDGWIYNITTATWTNIPALDALGARKDHFAVSYGGQVLFGFGYGQSGPFNASLAIFDPASQTFQTSFTPPPPTSSASPTIPVASATDTGIGGSHSGSATLTGSVHPTSSGGGGGDGGGGNNGSGGGGNGNGNGSGGGGGDVGKDPQSTSSKTTAIAIGTVLGVLALVGMGVGAFWYLRKRQQHRWAEGGVGGIFSPLNDEDGAVGGGGAPSRARMFDAPPTEKGLVGGAVESVGATFSSWGLWAAAALGIAGAAGASAAAAKERRRRDMLADEDTRDFGGWYEDGDGHSSRLGRFRQGSGGSSWSLMSVFRPKPVRQGSAASGMSFGSRGASLLGHGDPAEKDPFRDEMYMHDAAAAGGAGALAATARPKGHRQASYASINSMGSNYIDPFADPISEQDLAGPGALLLNMGHGFSRPGPLSPVTEISRSSASQSGSSSDHHAPSPFSTMSRSSIGFTSNSHQGSPALPLGASPAATPGTSTSLSGTRPSSILDMKPQPPAQPIQRSDTWWARFANKSLLDRRSSRGSANNVAGPDIRDPNPLPQRLGFVKEETSSVLRERSDGSDNSARAGPVYERGALHGKSMSSIQTQQTADSAAIERMGGYMDVMLRGNRQSGSTSTRGSTITHGGTAHGSVDEGHSQRQSWHPVDDDGEQVYTSPVEMVPASAFNLPVSPPVEMVPASAFGLPTSPPREHSPPPTLSAAAPTSPISDRIKAYERRMSQDVSAPPPPTNTKQREERPRKRAHSNYGIVPRASLFVANPDGARQGSGDS